jgi:hypothetical protein
MMRALIALLLLANLAFFAWTQGWLDSVVGIRSIGDREPERLLRQVRPELIRILPPASGANEAAPALATTSSADGTCLEAGPFTDTELTAAQATLQTALPAGAWAVVKVEPPGAWMVYMGRYASTSLLTKKEDELKRRKIAYDEVAEPRSLVPGLSLGRFAQRPAAVAALDQFARQGIQTARVVEVEPPASRTLLRVAGADAALAEQLLANRGEALGKGFALCATPPVGN